MVGHALPAVQFKVPSGVLQYKNTTSGVLQKMLTKNEKNSLQVAYVIDTINISSKEKIKTKQKISCG